MTHFLSLPTLALAAVAVTAVVDTTAAQTLDLAGVTNNRGFYQPGSRRNVVTYGNHMYAVFVDQVGAVRLRRRVNDVDSVWNNWGPVVNNTATGITGTQPTTTVAMAVTRSGHLHITWGRYYYPSFYQQYYRCLELTSGSFTHLPQNIHALVGATPTSRTDSCAVAVGPNDQVYLTAPDGPSSWRSRLLEGQFTSFPTGLAPMWFNRGSIAVSASSQNVRMVVDSQGFVQMSFYNNVSPGQYATRVFQSPSTWSAQEQIGVPPVPRDNTGYLATDFTRFTHVLYLHVASQVGSVLNYELQYRKRWGMTPWSAPITVHAFSSVDSGADTPRYGYAIAATTKGDRVFAIYREYPCGRMMVKQLKAGGSDFEFLAELEAPTSATNDYFLPNVRNTLWPAENGMYQFLDVSYRRPSGSTYRLVHQRLNIGAMDVNATGCPGSCGTPANTFGGVPCSFTMPHTVMLGLERARPGAPAFLLYTLSPSFSVPFAGCNLYANTLLFSTTVDPCCHAELSVPLPPGCFSLDIYTQWAVLDGAAIGGWAMSNRGKISL